MKNFFTNHATFLLFTVAMTAFFLFPAGEPTVHAADKKTEETVKDAEAAKPDEAAKTESPEDYFEQYRLLIDTIDQVDRNYVDKFSRRELIEAAIRGVMKKLDPYSDYIPPEEMEKFRTHVDSKFGGIGIQVNTDGRRLIVVAPLAGTPAYDAGVFSGDVILEINGIPGNTLSVDEAVSVMKGDVGTPVTLKLLRQGNPEPFTAEVFREIIHIETVMGFDRNADDTWNYWLDPRNGVAYVHISTFSHATSKELKKVLETLKDSTDTAFKALILDLRFNPGGILPVAVDVCDMFVPEGRIVSIKGRNTEEQAWDAAREKTVCDVPMTVLINHYSASASEIVAACLQDHHRATVVGDRSWGKGSVQNVMEMENGTSALKLTTAGYFRPNGKNIHRTEDASESDEWGVTPEAANVVPMTANQIYRLMTDQRRRQELLTHKSAAGRQAAAAQNAFFEDPQLRRALELMQRAVGSRDTAQNVLRERMRAVPGTVSAAAGRETHQPSVSTSTNTPPKASSAPPSRTESTRPTNSGWSGRGRR